MFSLKAVVQTKTNEILLQFWPLCPKLRVSVFQSNKQLKDQNSILTANKILDNDVN